jgi:nucleotide-binding universal stress UspA family protein
MTADASPPPAQPRSFRRILVPLDGSRLAEAVLPLVLRLASRLSADVELLHVIERRAPARVHGDRHLQGEAEARDYLFGEVAPQLQASGIETSGHVHDVPEGDVAASIARHVAELSADLVVLATHGSGGMRDILFGSVAQQVLARTDVPLLLVRPDRVGWSDLRRVLVPLDGTPDGEAALTVAADLARPFEAEVLVLRVVPTWSTVAGERTPGAVMLPSATVAALALQARAAESYLTGITARLADVRIRGLVRRGEPGREILEAVRSEVADLLAMSTHGRAGLEAAWAGSLAARVLKALPVPALLVRI